MNYLSLSEHNRTTVTMLPLLAAIALCACPGSDEQGGPRPAPVPPPAPALATRPAPEPDAARAAASFRCPACGQGSLAVVRTLRFLSDGYSDDLALQAIQCERCGRRGVATYEASRHGSDERFHHLGGWLRPQDHDGFMTLIKRCPAPDDRRCSCRAHRTYYQLDGQTWKGLRMFHLVGDSFVIRLK